MIRTKAADLGQERIRFKKHPNLWLWHVISIAAETALKDKVKHESHEAGKSGRCLLMLT